MRYTDMIEGKWYIFFAYTERHKVLMKYNASKSGPDIIFSYEYSFLPGTAPSYIGAWSPDDVHDLREASIAEVLEHFPTEIFKDLNYEIY